MKGITAAIIAALFILMPAVLAGVTMPVPESIQLLPGESGRFKFQIQTVAMPRPVECAYTATGTTPLVVEFDDHGSAYVEANSRKTIYGTVTAPDDAPLGAYGEKFCVSCIPREKGSGASVQIEICDLPVNVEVVSARTRENMALPEKPSDFHVIGRNILYAIIALILLYTLYQFYVLRMERLDKRMAALHSRLYGRDGRKK